MTAPYTAISPAHYRDHASGVEPIEFTRAMTFCAGNAAKYICRAGLKGSALEDWRKAAQYLEWAAETGGSAFFRVGVSTKIAASALELMRLYIAGEGNSAKASALDRIRRSDYPDALSIARAEIARLEAEEAP